MAKKISLNFGGPIQDGPLYYLKFGESASGCSPDWTSQQGDQLVIRFAPCPNVVPTYPWTSQQGDQLVIKIGCCEEQPPKEPVILGPFEFESGEIAIGDIRTYSNISGGFYSGENVNLNLTTIAVHNLHGVVHNGEHASGELSTTDALRFVFGQTGEAFSFDLKLNPVALLELASHTGENVKGSLSATPTFGFEFFQGEYVYGELEVEPYEGIRLLAQTGENVKGTLDTLPGIALRGLTGESLEASLNTLDVLSGEAYIGEFVKIELKFPENVSISLDGLAGESFNFSLASSGSLGVAHAYSGETFEIDFEDRPSLAISGKVFTGEDVSIEVSYADNLGDFLIYSGEYAKASLDSLENYHIHIGETSSVSISTATTFEGLIDSGESCQVVLDTRPSEPIGFFNGYSGEDVYFHLDRLRAVYLSGVIYDSYEVRFGIPAIGTNFDLNTVCFRQERENPDFHRIEINYEAEPGQEYWGDKVCAVMSLQTQPRFQMQAYTGEFVNPEYVTEIFPEGRMFYGEYTEMSLESANINFGLCPANFIPDAESVYVELDFSESESCYADQIYTGEIAVGWISASPNFQGDIRTGETFVFTLHTDEIIEMKAYTGEYATLQNPEMTMRAYSGESVTMRTYEPPIVVYTGETMTGDISITYDVEFLERGCLDNEYIHQNENGDPIPEKFNPVPVEKDPYLHDIKARCF